MGNPAPAKNTAKLMVNVFDGARQPFAPGTDVLIRICNGYQDQITWQDYKAPSVDFEVPFYDNDGGDAYSVVVSTNGYNQSGFVPIPVSPKVHQGVDLMLVPKGGSFHFANARWADIQARLPLLANILNASTPGNDASAFYTDACENSPKNIACLLNLATAMSQIHLRVGTPLDYFKTIYINDLRQDRFFAHADPALVEQATLATSDGLFTKESDADLALHSADPTYGKATSSFKQIQFGEANVQLTFHGMDNGLIVVEPDIDYYKDLLAHAILEVIPNAATGGLTDPMAVYILRWIAGQRAGIPQFDPLYTVE
jgi:hypothetical protein